MRPIARTALLGVAFFLLSGQLVHAAAQATACALLSRADAARILAKPAIKTAQVITDDEEDCGYLAAGFDLHTEQLRSVPGWSAWKKGLIAKGQAEAVDGVGEEAAMTKDGNGDFVMVARKGGRIVSVTMYADQWPADQVKPALLELLKAAVGKLP